VNQFDLRLIQMFQNSLIVSGAAAILSTFAGSLCAYAISRFYFRFKSILLLFFLASMAFPVPMLMITMYSTFHQLGLLDTYWALILGNTAMGLPLSVWLMTNFIDQIPIDMEEAALLDGASPFSVLMHIVLPMVRPGLAASGIFVFVTSWNELLMGLTFVSSPEVRTLPAGITLAFLGEFEGDWSEMMALAFMFTLPVFLLFMIMQKSILKGMTAGALK
jgi:multiple sugar transport system permease protein